MSIYRPDLGKWRDQKKYEEKGIMGLVILLRVSLLSGREQRLGRGRKADGEGKNVSVKERCGVSR